MGFFSAVKRFFSGGSQPAEEVKQKEAPEESPKDEGTGPAGETPEEPADSEPVQPAPEAEEAGGTACRLVAGGKNSLQRGGRAAPLRH